MENNRQSHHVDAHWPHGATSKVTSALRSLQVIWTKLVSQSLTHTRKPSSALSLLYTFWLFFDSSIDAGRQLPHTIKAGAIFALTLTEGYFGSQYVGRDMSAVQHQAPSKRKKKGKRCRPSALGRGERFLLSFGQTFVVDLKGFCDKQRRDSDRSKFLFLIFRWRFVVFLSSVQPTDLFSLKPKFKFEVGLLLQVTLHCFKFDQLIFNLNCLYNGQ